MTNAKAIITFIFINCQGHQPDVFNSYVQLLARPIKYRNSTLFYSNKTLSYASAFNTGSFPTFEVEVKMLISTKITVNRSEATKIYFVKAVNDLINQDLSRACPSIG